MTYTLSELGYFEVLHFPIYGENGEIVSEDIKVCFWLKTAKGAWMYVNRISMR